VFFVLGIRRKAQKLATVFAVCGVCHTPAAQTVNRLRTFFTVFFIPLIPLASRYYTTCTMCGQSVKITREAAEHLVASTQAQVSTQTPYPMPTSGQQMPPPPPPPVEIQGPQS
jgi:hypothetical protein